MSTTYQHLSEVVNTLTRYSTDKQTVRGLLWAMRDTHTPLYVCVASNGRACIVSEYVPAMVLHDTTDVRVYSVWRDTYRVWHVVEQ